MKTIIITLTALTAFLSLPATASDTLFDVELKNRCDVTLNLRLFTSQGELPVRLLRHSEFFVRDIHDSDKLRFSATFDNGQSVEFYGNDDLTPVGAHEYLYDDGFRFIDIRLLFRRCGWRTR